MTVYIFDLRGLDKPTHTTPARQGGKLRPHYSTNAAQRQRRAAAREAGGIDRIVLHQWAAEIRAPTWSDDSEDLDLEAAALEGGAEVGVDVLGVNRYLAALGADDADKAAAAALAYRAAGLSFYGWKRDRGGAPYHISVGATRRGSGVVALVWPQLEHTFHAGTQNARSIGVGVMGRFERDEEGTARPGLSEALAWALALAAGMVAGDDIDAHLDTISATPVPSAPGSDGWRMDGPPPAPEGPPVLLATHSQSDRKPADPGLYAIRYGVAPAVRAGWLHVEPEWATGKGQPWPASWREEVRRA